MSAALKKMLAARKARDDGNAALLDATKAAFPVGTEVVYRYQRAGRTHEIYAKVTGHGCEWHHQDYIQIENLNTGAKRSVCAPFHAERGELEVLP